MKTRELAYTGILAALIAVCSWISIPPPSPSPYTHLCRSFLHTGPAGGAGWHPGGDRLSAAGGRGTARLCRLPRRPGGLSGCHGRLSGGLPFYRPHHVGRRAMAGKIAPVFLGSAVVGQILCYLFGSVWYYAVYTSSSGPVGMFTVLAGVCSPSSCPTQSSWRWPGC